MATREETTETTVSSRTRRAVEPARNEAKRARASPAPPAAPPTSAVATTAAVGSPTGVAELNLLSAAPSDVCSAVAKLMCGDPCGAELVGVGTFYAVATLPTAAEFTERHVVMLPRGCMSSHGRRRIDDLQRGKNDARDARDLQDMLDSPDGTRADAVRRRGGDVARGVKPHLAVALRGFDTLATLDRAAGAEVGVDAIVNGDSHETGAHYLRHLVCSAVAHRAVAAEIPRHIVGAECAAEFIMPTTGVFLPSFFSVAERLTMSLPCGPRVDGTWADLTAVSDAGMLMLVSTLVDSLVRVGERGLAMLDLKSNNVGLITVRHAHSGVTSATFSILLDMVEPAETVFESAVSTVITLMDHKDDVPTATCGRRVHDLYTPHALAVLLIDIFTNVNIMDSFARWTGGPSLTDVIDDHGDDDARRLWGEFASTTLLAPLRVWASGGGSDDIPVVARLGGVHHARDDDDDGGGGTRLIARGFADLLGILADADGPLHSPRMVARLKRNDFLRLGSKMLELRCAQGSAFKGEDVRLRAPRAPAHDRRVAPTFTPPTDTVSIGATPVSAAQDLVGLDMMRLVSADLPPVAPIPLDELELHLRVLTRNADAAHGHSMCLAVPLLAARAAARLVGGDNLERLQALGELPPTRVGAWDVGGPARPAASVRGVAAMRHVACKDPRPLWWALVSRVAVDVAVLLMMGNCAIADVAALDLTSVAQGGFTIPTIAMRRRLGPTWDDKSERKALPFTAPRGMVDVFAMVVRATAAEFAAVTRAVGDAKAAVRAIAAAAAAAGGSDDPRSLRDRWEAHLHVATHAMMRNVAATERCCAAFVTDVLVETAIAMDLDSLGAASAAAAAAPPHPKETARGSTTLKKGGKARKARKTRKTRVTATDIDV